jgi:hypothetical protein
MFRITWALEFCLDRFFDGGVKKGGEQRGVFSVAPNSNHERMVMAKALSAKSVFIKPRFIDTLGEEGLTAKDIADSLGVELKSVHKKIKRSWLTNDKSALFKAVPFDSVNDSNGLSFETYALDTVSAKAFVARWKNAVGDSYLGFLFGCERVAMQELPRLQAELETAKAALLRIEGPKKPHHLTNTTLVPVYQAGMFGDEIVEYRRVARDDTRFSELSRIEGKMAHFSNCIEGMANALKILAGKAAIERRK